MSRLSLLAAVCAASFAFAAPPAQPKIQIAILLDTSGSMDGLINQTREQLWRIVNTFATAKKDGQRPTLELALYQYGNDGISAQAHHVQRIVPLTGDLDRVSEALFKLTTNGGNEYCGAAISHAMDELAWSQSPKDLKLLYIAGNEPFSQGPIDFRKAVKAAIGRGIVVNTIHAGSEAQGVRDAWAEAARLADGNFLFVDSNRAVARIDAPQDVELAALSVKLNQTYVAYGARGAEAKRRQVAQDQNAGGVSAQSLSTRAAAKASANYRNDDWDLVDARARGASVAEVPTASLPAEMQAMSAQEREAWVEKKSKERAELQGKILELTRARERYVAEVRAQQAGEASMTLDDALIESARKQATKADFSL